MGARAERAKLEVLVNVGGHVSHHPRSEAHALAVRCRSYAFDIAGPERPAVDLELAVDHRRVRDDLAFEVEHEMHATDRVLPILLGERLVIRVERSPEQLAYDRDLGGSELVRGHHPDRRSIDHRRPTIRNTCPPGAAK